MRSARIALGLIFGMAVLGDRTVVMAEPGPPQPAEPAPWSQTIDKSCEEVAYKPFITDDQMKTARDHFGNDERLSDDELKDWVIRHFDLFGGYISLPDLTAHPLAGRKVAMINVRGIDGLGQEGESEKISCTLPERGYFNPIGRRIAVIRGDIAEATIKIPPAPFFAQQLPLLSQRFHALIDADINAIQNPDTRIKLQKLAPEFDAAHDMTQVGALLDDLWKVTLELEDDHLSESAKEMRDARAMLKKAYAEHAIDEKKLQEFLEKAKSGMEKFLDEQIKEAQKNGDKELEKKLEELKNQLEELQKALEKKDKKTLNDALDMYDLMREMMRMQQGMQSMQEMMQNSQSMMQQMMQQMQEQLQNQQMMQNLEKMIQEQQQLLDDTSKTEAERKEMMDNIRNGLNEQAQDAQERAKKAREGEEADAQKQKDKNAAANKADIEEQAKAFEKTGQQLKDAVEKRMQDDALPPDQAERLKDVQKALDKDLEQLKKPDTLKQKDLEKILKDFERASSELDRMTDQKQATPPESMGKDVDNLSRETDRAKSEQQQRDGQLQQMQEGSKELKSAEDALKKLQEKLQNPDMDQKQLREAVKELNDLKDKISKHEKADMSAIEKMILALAAQLDDRVDEAGAYAYRVETGLRRAGDIANADMRAADQSRAVQLGEDITTIREDTSQRLEKEAPLTEQEAQSLIARLKEIKTDLDKIDPRPQRENDNKDQDSQNGGGGNQQQQMQPDELMKQLMEMMRKNKDRSQGQQQMEDSLQKMMNQSQGLQQKQQSIQEMLEQMRQQLQKNGTPQDQIDSIMKQMQDAADKLQQGQPGGSMPSQSKSLQEMMQMQQQQQMQQMPGKGEGEGPGQGRNGSTGHSMFPPERMHDMTGDDGPISDPSKAGNELRRIQEDIRKMQDGKQLPPAVQKYYNDLLRTGPR